jgi:hypothetical protein
MIEKKDSLSSLAHNYYFDNALEINVEREGFDVTLEIKELNIKTDGIAQLVELFENRYTKLNSALQFTDEELKQKRFLDKLGITREPVKKKRGKINSRAKGARGERFFIDELKKDKFFPHLKILRTPGSGAFSTTHNLKITDDICLAGDIFAEKNHEYLEEYEIFNSYIFEAKNYKDLPHLLKINNTSSEPITDWIEKEESDCNNFKKKFIILFKANHSRSYAMFRYDEVKDKDFYDSFLIILNHKGKKYCIFFLSDINFT